MSDPSQRKKISAEEYLAQIRASWVMEHVTMELVRHKPNDPIAFMARRFKTLVPFAVSKKPAGSAAATPTSADLLYTQPKLIAVLGGPCSGKDLMTAHLGEQGMISIDVNDLILAEMRGGTAAGQEISDTVARGEEIPPPLIAALIKACLTDPAATYAINGFPRTLKQTMELERSVGELSAVFVADCPAETMRARMSASQVVSKEQDARLLRHARDTLPVIRYYEALGRATTVDTATDKAHMLATVKRIAWS